MFLLANASGATADGAAIYSANCAKCHGATGNADTPVGKAMKAPVLAGTSHTVEQVTKAVREDPKHKAVSPKVEDEEIAELVAFLETLGS